MKEIIKTTIALVFIIGAYILGCHHEDEKHSGNLNEMKVAISNDKEHLTRLQDSIGKLNHTIDTLKTKIQIEVTKKDKRQRQSLK